MFKLVISDDEGKTIIVPLVRDQITVGRQDGNTIRLTERNVSRQHARLVKVDKGYRVEDLESYNGVTLNGARIDKQSDLKDGDRVGIGDYVIALKAEAESAAAAPAAPRASAPPTTGGAPARLVMISAPAPGAEFSIAKGAVRIGRLEELDLCISHRSISREHARVLQKDGSFEVEDLNSANGVRINGSTTKKGPLKSGDILELGQVRFRFVGPGETYVFEASEEEQAAAAVPAAGAGPRRRTVAVIAVAAAVVGGVLAFMDDGDAKQPEAAQNTYEPEPQVVEPVQDDEVRRQLAAALEGCRTALAGEQYADAVRAAQNGLALDESDATLNECKRSAEEAIRVAGAFEEGKQAFAQGKLEDAYFLFAGLPESYRERPEIKQAAQRVALARLSEARSQLRSNPREARRLAGMVLEMPGLTATMVQDAQRLEASASRALAATPETAPPSEAAPSRPPREASIAPGKDEDNSPARVARGCLARGDQRCAVRALEGNAESAQELALLIETYRALGETKKAVKHMESFVTRYPTARQAPQYRQFVAKHEQ